MAWLILRTGTCPFPAIPAILIIHIACASLASIDRAVAGGSPETTLLVVNADSPLSLTVANEYVRLRDIPPTHLLWLHGIPSLTIITVDAFRDRIWGPINAFITEHGLQEEIDLIVYSADFPYAVDFEADLKPHKIKLRPPFSQGASLTGMTFFANQVQRKDISYLSPRANPYFRYDYSRADFARTPWTDKEIRLLSEGNQAMKDKDYATAQDRFLTYLNQRPGHGAAWYQLALLYALQTQQNQAIETLAKAVERGYVHLLRVQREKAWDPYRNIPPFQDVIKKMAEMDVGFLPPLGFKHQHYTWRSRMEPGLYLAPIYNTPERYYLSMMLAYTGERGNSLGEIRNYLASAAGSDATHPDGTVYLMENPNVRSTTRQPFFRATSAALARIERKAEILRRGHNAQDGIFPIGKRDILGVVAGTKYVKWEHAKSKFLPGAIAESLTSYGAKFASRKQTKLTEYLRYGASASSGAVAEPYAVQEKFPVSHMHFFYAAGCSIAEAFYQSLATPYQLLIVGDPLARPFANFARIRLHQPEGLIVNRIDEVPAAVQPVLDREISQLELWVDGDRVKTGKLGDTLTWDTKAFADGYHELRIVAEEAGLVATRSYSSISRHVANNGFRPIIKAYDGRVSLDDTISIHGKARGAKAVEIRQGHRVLENKLVQDSDWKAVVRASRLGMGSVRLTVITIYPNNSVYINAPLTIDINPPKRLLKGVYSDRGEKGILVKLISEKSTPHELVLHPKNGTLDIERALKKAKIRETFKSAKVDGRFYVEQSGFYQIAVKFAGEIRIIIDGIEQASVTRPQKGGLSFFPMALQKGWHNLLATAKGGPISRLYMLLSGTRVARPFADEIFRYDPRRLSKNSDRYEGKPD